MSKKINKERKFLEERITSLKESLNFFSNKRKSEREQWVVQEFMSYLKIEHKPGEIRICEEDPPDILFRDARFEIKEILNQNRKRTREYEEKLSKANQATKSSELLEHYTPIDISINDALQVVSSKGDEYNARYSSSFCETLDLLFYLNLRGTTVERGELPMTVTKKIEDQSWRSVSVVSNNCAFVVCAKDAAPQFIKVAIGKVLKKKIG